MTDIDLTSVVEAAARGAYEDAPGEGPAWDDLPQVYRHQVRETVLPFVTHAAPLIARQVREQVAREIQTLLTDEATRGPSVCEDADEGWCHRDSAVTVLARAARIARGEAS